MGYRGFPTTRHEDLLFVGIGWADLTITLNRIAVGAFFMLSGYHKLFNAERTVQSPMTSRRSAFMQWACGANGKSGS
jgi:uncharacterized membrane protein YphA (DoxX/SURF4 family)